MSDDLCRHVVTAAYFRRNVADVLERVELYGEVIRVTRHGQTAGYLVPEPLLLYLARNVSPEVKAAIVNAGYDLDALPVPAEGDEILMPPAARAREELAWLVRSGMSLETFVRGVQPLTRSKRARNRLLKLTEDIDAATGAYDLASVGELRGLVKMGLQVELVHGLCSLLWDDVERYYAAFPDRR